MLKVLIADDKPTICELIYRLVDRETLGLQCIGKAQNVGFL